MKTDVGMITGARVVFCFPKFLQRSFSIPFGTWVVALKLHIKRPMRVLVWRWRATIASERWWRPPQGFRSRCLEPPEVGVLQWVFFLWGWNKYSGLKWAEKVMAINPFFFFWFFKGSKPLPPRNSRNSLANCFSFGAWYLPGHGRHFWMGSTVVPWTLPTTNIGPENRSIFRCELLVLRRVTGTRHFYLKTPCC